MPEPDLIEIFAQPLNDAAIEYLISGSVAAMLYGEPRVTHDIDMIVFLQDQDAAQLATIFPKAQFYVPPLPVILEELRRERLGHFNLIHVESGLKADFYPAGRDNFHFWALRHARRYTIGASTITVAPPEYVILRKLEYHREGGSEKHLRDIRSILAVSGDELDPVTLTDWANRLNLQEEWKRLSLGE
jgi:hypothetical protein